MSVIITVKTVKKNNKRRKRIIMKNKHDGNFCEKKMFLKPSSFHNIKSFDSILKNSVEVKMT